MSKRKTLKRKLLQRSNGHGRAIVTLEPSELETFRSNAATMQAALNQFNYINEVATEFQRDLRDRYELPTRFEIDLETGVVYPAKEKEPVNVA